MNRHERREEKFAKIRQPKPPAEVLTPLTLDWTTPGWTKETRYRQVTMPNGDMLIAKPTQAGMSHQTWNAVWNTEVLRKDIPTLNQACAFLEEAYKARQS